MEGGGRTVKGEERRYRGKVEGGAVEEGREEGSK